MCLNSIFSTGMWRNPFTIQQALLYVNLLLPNATLEQLNLDTSFESSVPIFR